MKQIKKGPPLPKPKKKVLTTKQIKKMYLEAQELIKLCADDHELF